MSGVLVRIIHVLVDTVLLHDEDSRADMKQIIQLILGEGGKTLDMQCAVWRERKGSEGVHGVCLSYTCKFYLEYKGGACGDSWLRVSAVAHLGGYVYFPFVTNAHTLERYYPSVY